MVSFNYRLGALGFLSDPSVSPEIGSNQAMCDQLLALERVHKHIGSYGGVRQRITIFGASSGGSAIMSLLQTPTAEGLFARAIIQSGSTSSGWQRPPVQESLAQLFLSSIAGCEDLHCTKRKGTTSQVLEYQGRLFRQAQGLFSYGQVNFVEPVRPVIDGELLTEDWIRFWATTGTTRCRRWSLMPATSLASVEFLATFLLGEQRTNTVLNSPILGVDRSLIDAPDVTDSLIQLTTDITYRCSSENAGYLERHIQDVWEMSWDIGLSQFLAGSICGNGTHRACHAVELPILFASANYANISSDVLVSVNYFQQARRTKSPVQRHCA
ncbi:Alpha/Beta hydrolase protein [Aspergillus fruticulosus]